MKLAKSIALIAALALGGGAMLYASSLKSGEAQPGVEKAQDEVVKKIDQSYLKKNIYDWTESPGKFTFKGTRPAVIDFYADWCGPCRRLSPKMEEVAKKYQGKVDFYKVDVDKETTLAKVFGVRSIPMVLFIPTEGTPIMTQGDLPMAEIEAAIAKINK